ncbi:MAG: NUDIX domain-containing protein [bacterium]|nr:NUDIX domain-containing protein [bacterium]
MKYETDTWPRTCVACGHTAYRNPIPVVVIIQPIDDGVLVIRRGIEPERGKLALPGGYLDWGETWQQGAVRELAEETGMIVVPERVTLFDAVSTPDGLKVILFALMPRVSADTLPPFAATAETLERTVINHVASLAFPMHTRVVARYFQQEPPPSTMRVGRQHETVTRKTASA